MALTTLREELNSASDPAAKTEVEQRISESESIAGEQRNMALATLQRALELAEQSTSQEFLNALRYRMSYVYYVQQQYLAAAVIAEHVIRFYPNSEVARMCGEIAMASYQQLYTLNDSDEKRFEMERLVAVADRIAETWPDTPESERALLTLVNFMILQQELDLAESYLQKIPADSQKRAAAELTTGQALWAEYLKRARAAKEGGDADHGQYRDLEQDEGDGPIDSYQWCRAYEISGPLRVADPLYAGPGTNLRGYGTGDGGAGTVK